MGPVDCASAAALLQEYLDSELDERNSKRVADHLELCRQCGLSAETYRSIRTSLARSQQPSPDTLERLHHFADNIADQPRRNTASDA